MKLPHHIRRIRLSDKAKRRLAVAGRWTRRAVIAAAVIALLVAWGRTIFVKTVDRTDPADVSRQFILELQQYHPHQAYVLTSSQYHKTVKEEEFANNFATSVRETIPQSEPRLFRVSRPPGGKENGREERYYVYNLYADGEQKDHQAGVRLVKEGENWNVDAMNLMLGLAKPSDTTGAKDTKK